MNTLLMHGNCLEKMLKLPDDSIDMILTDLPYGTTKNVWDSIIPLEPLWEQYNRVCKGRIVLFCAQPFTTILIHSNIKSYNHEWTWIKNKSTGFQSAKHQPLRKTENIIVFNRGKYNPQDLIKIDKVCKNGKNVGGGNLNGDGEKVFKPGSIYVQEFTGYPHNILEYSLDSSKKGEGHPTQKPVALLEYLIKTYSDEDDVILDSTMGSGSTGVAAVNTNRNFVGIEKDPGWFKHAKERINNGN